MVRSPRFWIVIALALAACAVGSAQSSISGRLLQKRGDALTPLTGCTVMARSIDNGPLVGEYPDSQGRFRLDFPPDSRVTVGTLCPGYRIFAINGRRTLPPTHDCSAPGPCAELELTLEPLAVIEGYVVDDNGMAVEQITVELRQNGGPQAQPRQTSTDDRGYFRFYYLPPGEYEVEPTVRRGQYQGFTWAGDTQSVSARAGETVSVGQIRLRAVEPLELSGRIAGLPAGTRSVFLFLRGRGQGNMLGQTVAVDPEGRFRLTGIPPGQYQVQMNLNHPGPAIGERASSQLGTIDLQASTTDVLLTQSESGRLQGKIQTEWPDRDDLPPRAPNDPVFFRLVPADSAEGSGNRHPEPQGIRGREQWVPAQPPDYEFHVDDLQPGVYKLLFNGPGANVSQRNAAGEWEPLRQVEIRAGKTAELTLRVRFEVGRLTVRVKPPGAGESDPNQEPAYFVVGIRGNGPVQLYSTDQNGRLVLRYFAGGDYEICAWSAMTPEQAADPATWQAAGDAVRQFHHEGESDMEITLTAAPQGSAAP